MAKAFKVNYTTKPIKEYNEKTQRAISKELTAGALQISNDMKRFAPVDEGLLRNEIYTDTSRFLKAEVGDAAFYAPYMEFGTGKRVKIPAGYTAFAAQFKGPAGRGGNMWQFLQDLAAWVRRKGLSGTYRVKATKTGKHTRVGKRDRQTQEDYEVAYAIMIDILRNGVRPHPYFIPAINANKDKITENIKRVTGAV